MQVHRKHLLRNLSTIVMTLALGVLFLAEGASALPSYPTTSANPEGNQTSSGNSQSGNNQGPYLISGSSSWASWGNHHAEDYDEEWLDHTGDDDNGDDSSSTPVPEPTTALLMSLGLASAAYLKRRRQ